MQPKQHAPSAARGLMSIDTLYSYLFCTMASNLLVSLPILGGTLYLAGRSAVLLGHLRRPIQEGVLSKSFRRTCTVLLILLFLSLMALTMIYPIRLENADFWRLAGLVFCIILRPAVMRYLLERDTLNGQKPRKTALRLVGVQALFLPPLLLMLLWSPLERTVAWSLLGGYAVSGLLEWLSLGRWHDRIRTWVPEDQTEIDALRGVHAYRIFQNASLVIAAALQVTQVMTYTYIAVTAGALILCMVIALLCTYFTCLVVDFPLNRSRAKNSDPNFLLISGLAIWLYGLILFIRSLDMPDSVGGYLALALCTVGVTACVRVALRMEGHMRRVAAFAIGHMPSAAVDAVQQVRLDFASLLGQVIALVGLTLICVFTATDFPNDWDAIFRSFSPLLTLPALALVTAALLFALRFPLTRQHMEKLQRYIALRQQGEENGPLRDQLEAVVVRRSLKHYGIKVILFILRPLYYHKIKGRENIRLDDDIPCIFVCNHGEIYGPVATNLYVPYSFRPWVTYEMLEKEAVMNRTMNGVFQDVKGRRRKALHFLMNHIGAPFLVWVMRSVDAIPVYHDNPRLLRQTFRETTAAMEAGDNILLFPENAATSSTRRYAREGVSEFFTGFTMIGQLYHARTGKCPLFVPLYANKKERTITFGTPTRYNPDRPSGEEKERLCNYLRGEMLRIAQQPENSPAS